MIPAPVARSLRGSLTALLLLSLIGLAGCDPLAWELRMQVHAQQQFDKDALHAVFVEQSRVTILPLAPEPGQSALEALTAGEVELGLVENSAAFVPGIRAILPVYKSVLHILIREDFEFRDGPHPMQDVSVHIMNQSTAGLDFVDLIMRRQGMGPDDYSRDSVITPGVTDVIIYFGPVNPDDTSWYLPGYRLLSLADELNPERRFYQEGIGYIAPNLQPLVIPPLTYLLPGNQDELHTLAVDTLLVTRRDVSEPAIYELTRTFLQQKPRFVAIAPQLFSGINESFDPLNLNFPLHSGARRYLHRDEPSALERYAETINMLAYVFFLVMTGLFALARWRAQRKKDRIDHFYSRVLDIRARAGGVPVESLLRELQLVEREAFDSLIGEKLAANESFRIFTDLLAEARAELRAGGP